MNANRPKAAESWLEDHDVGRPEVKFLGRPFDSMIFRGPFFFFEGINIPSGKVTNSWLEKPPFLILRYIDTFKWCNFPIIAMLGVTRGYITPINKWAKNEENYIGFSGVIISTHSFFGNSFS